MSGYFRFSPGVGCAIAHTGLWLIAFLACGGSQAEMTCEQLGAIAQETVQQRDRGASLSRLVADVERGEMKTRLTERELALVKEVIRLSFNGTLSPVEVVEACQQGGAIVPAR